MKILYFAWLRAKIGTGEERIAPPAGIATVGQLARWLREQSAGHAEAFADLSVIRAAVNHEFVDFDAAVAPGDEVAFFPPVTGG